MADKGTNKSRTPSGAPSAAERKRSGEKKGGQKGKFPIFDKKSAESAIKLRGRAKTPAERASIIRRAAKYAPEAAKKAREADSNRKDK